MIFFLTRSLILSAVLLAAGCTFFDETLLPTLTGDNPPSVTDSEEVASTEPAGTTSEAAASPMSRGNPYVLASPEAGQPTGTDVGAEIVTLRDRFTALQETINNHSGQFASLQAATAENLKRYYGTTAAINTRLQLGTTKANPLLTNQLAGASRDIDQIEADLATISGLSDLIARDSREADDMLASIRAAFEQPGAIDEDHRQLMVLEDEASRAAVLTKRLVTQMNADVRRQTPYVGLEKSNLAKLAVAIRNGGFLEEGTMTATAATTLPTTSSAAPVDSEQALVIIRFDREDVDYEQPLFDAISQAMESRPQSSFDVVSISPLTGAGDIAATQARSAENAGRVLQSLTAMGLPASRINLSTASNGQVSSNEVRIYVR